MANYFDKAEIFAWMPLVGFDKDAPDKGVGALVERAGFDLNGVCLFVFHPDFVHHHTGMDNIRALPPDNCSYYGNPYNEERKRQEWTNHDVRDLVSRLKGRGTECFISIMGISTNNHFHDEWIYEHPELMNVFTNGSRGGLNVLKRFADGTYYEDYFADKICEVMEDYGLSGLHVADNFCPSSGCVEQGDYSYDMIEQFVTATGYEMPRELLERREDSDENIFLRHDYIWANCRAEWIEFRAKRWEQFWKKLCARLHAIGKKVFVLGMYCTDPFDTLYTKGIDLRKIVNAGVDYLMPNMHANTSLIARKRPWRYYEWANMMCLTDAFAPQARKLNMLCVKDAAEQWDMLHHAPMLLERDISFLPSYVRYSEEKTKRCIDGYNICLADGIYKEEWKWLCERFEVAFDEVPEKILTPTLVWSDTAFDNTLRAYIKTRRWTLHKFIYEINKAGAHCGAIVRTEDITDKCGDLFVPNFDLLSETEKKQIASYTGGMIIATAAVENFNKDDYNCDFYVEDKNSPYPICVFVINGHIENRDELLKFAEEDDEAEAILDVNSVKEVINNLNHFMPYQKVSAGIVKMIAELLKKTFAHILKSTHPVIPMLMKDGRIRLYAMNDDLMHYAEANITVSSGMEKVENVSKFPLLPVRFSDTGNFGGFLGQDYPGNLHTFRLLIAQGGVSIVDIYLKNN